MWGYKLLILCVVISAAFSSPLLTEQVNKQDSRNGQFNIYYLYTRENPNEPQTLRSSPSSIANSFFDPSRDTAFVVHGHHGDGFNDLNIPVKDAYLYRYNANIIVVDWGVYASQGYSNAVSSVPSIGEGLASFIEFLVQQGLDLNKVHLIGFDLGAHVIGFTGRQLHGKVARITGLDPSSSRWGSRSGRLDATDGVYVEVIHTDGGLTGNGIGTNIGVTNFHPNGGTNQPGCLFNTCDHNRAWELFVASLLNNNFVARRCTGTQMTFNRCSGEELLMGNGDLEKPGYVPGEYRVNTGSRFPF